MTVSLNSYDALGRRAETTTGGSNHYDHIRDVTGLDVADWCAPCGTYNGSAVSYVHINGSLVAQYNNGTTYFAHPDHLGSTRLMTRLLLAPH